MLDERGWELDDAGGAARAAVLPLRIEHEVVDDQLTTPLEQVEEADGAVTPVERVVLLDLDHGEIAPLGVDPVAHTGELLLLRQQRGPRREPLLAGCDLGQAHRSLLTFVDCSQNNDSARTANSSPANVDLERELSVCRFHCRSSR